MRALPTASLALLLLTSCQHQATPTAAAEAPKPPPIAPPVPPKMRLGDSARPTRYALKLKVVPTEDVFSGTIAIDLALKEPVTTLWLNGSELKVGEATLEVDGRTSPVSTVDGGKQFIGFSFQKPAGPGNARLYVSFTGPVSSRDSRGLFRQQEGGDWYLISQFESHWARLAFPCFDEPSFKVPWRLTLEVRRHDAAFSNTPIESERDTNDGFKLVTFAETKPLPSYLIALGVGPFEVVDAAPAGRKSTPVRIVVPRGKSSQARYAAQVTPTILERLESYFDLPYPYEKLDLLSIPVPTDFGAMENPGLVTGSQTLYLARPEEESVQFKRAFASVTAHELGHMWFGDMVTLAWWDDTWLNEGFATWIASKIIEQWKPEWLHGTSVVNQRNSSTSADSLTTARKIRQPIESEHDIVNAFDAITYQKGAAVLAMFERWVGEDKFRRGIRRYLAQHAWGNATASDFLAAVSEEAGRDIAPAFSTFLEQAGVPLVTVALRCEAGSKAKLSLSQERYLPVGSGSSTDQTWQIPICARYPAGRSDAKDCTLLAQKTGELDLASAQDCPAWVMPNDGGASYYRVRFEGNLLGRVLKAGGKQLTLPERVGLVDDLAALTRGGRLPYGEVLPLITGLAGDPNREIVQRAAEIVERLRDPLIPASLRPSYAQFIRHVFGPRAGKLGWTAKRGEAEDTVLLRPTLVGMVAYPGDDEKLQREARQLARKWISDHRAVAADVVPTVLHVAAKTGDRALFDELHAAARRESDRRDRRWLLLAMGAFREPEIAKSALALALSDEFDPRESFPIVVMAAAAPETRDLAYQFIKENFDRWLARLPRDFGGHMPNLVEGYCDETHRADMGAFFKDRSTAFAGGPRRLANALERVDLCIAAKRVQQPSVEAFFRGKPKAPAAARLGSN